MDDFSLFHFQTIIGCVYFIQQFFIHQNHHPFGFVKKQNNYRINLRKIYHVHKNFANPDNMLLSERTGHG